jgi:hypothetical protein
MKTPGSDINNVVLIIIDQLRADYGRFLPKCSKLLPYSAICETGSIPASTEAMHANISTGEFPSVHGFISKIAKDGKDGLSQIIGKLERKELSSLASSSFQNGFKAYVIGGKAETAKVMGLPEECSLLLHYDRDAGLFSVQGTGARICNVVRSYLPQGRIVRKLEELDADLLGIFERVTSEKNKDNSLLVMALPSLDAIGHKHGPCSHEVLEHLDFLDMRVADYIKAAGSAKFIVTGDHGCRSTTKYVLEVDNADPRTVLVYESDGELFRLRERNHLDQVGNLSDIQYDGGILRAWFKKGAVSLSEEDNAFLMKCGCICGAGYDVGVDERLQLAYLNSRRENMGDVVVVPRPDSTFCKRKWVKKSTRDKLVVEKPVEKHELPLGEHGTHYVEDQQVPIISNFDFGVGRITNVQIRGYIEHMMTSCRQPK